MSIEDTDVVTNILESPKLDNGHTSRHLSQICTDGDEKCQQSMTSEGVEQDKMQMSNKRMANIQLKTLQERPLQCIQNNYAQHSLVLMMSSC